MQIIMQAGYAAATSGNFGDWEAVRGFATKLRQMLPVKGSVEAESGPAIAKLMAFYADKTNDYNGGYSVSLFPVLSVLTPRIL